MLSDGRMPCSCCRRCVLRSCSPTSSAARALQIHLRNHFRSISSLEITLKAVCGVVLRLFRDYNAALDALSPFAWALALVLLSELSEQPRVETLTCALRAMGRRWQQSLELWSRWAKHIEADGPYLGCAG